MSPPPAIRSRPRRAALAVSLITSAVAAMLAAPASAGAAATETRIGPVIFNVAVPGGAYGPGPHGAEYAYAVVTGSPAVLNVLDADTGARVGEYPLPGAEGSWGSTVTDDGAVYIATFSGGRLYRWRPGAAQAEDLGTPVPGESFIWRVATDGTTVYGGTYPSGHVFGYDTRTGRVRDYGQAREGQQYVRSVTTVRDKIYAGLGTPAHLVEIDAASGAKREILLPEAYRTNTFVYDVTGARNLLFVRPTDSSRLLVYDTITGEWVDDLGTAKGLDVSPPGPDNKVYYANGSGRLTSYDLVTRQKATTSFTGLASARGYGWVHLDTDDYPGATLVTMGYGGALIYFNPQTGSHRSVPGDVAGQPTSIQSLARGPDGRIYAGGYPSGGLAAYDPMADQVQTYQQGTLGQAENMLAFGGKLYAGVYPGAHIFAYDPAQPPVAGTNPKRVTTLSDLHQDRPFALAAAGERLAIGTVPAYGTLGGALALFDPVTGARQAYPNVVTDQSVTALAYHSGLIYGGTSVWGGLGSTPTQTDGKIFVFDPATGTKVWEGVPVPGERAITALTVGPNGHLYGATVGKVFEFDPATRSVLRVVEVAPFDWQVDHVWRADMLAFTAEGILRGQVNGRIVSVDPTTLAVTVHATESNLFAMDAAGAMYFSRGVDLYRLDLAS